MLVRSSLAWRCHVTFTCGWKELLIIAFPHRNTSCPSKNRKYHQTNKQTNSQRRDCWNSCLPKRTNSSQADQTSTTGNVLAEILSPVHNCAPAINGWLFGLMMWAWKRREPQKSMRYLIRCSPQGNGTSDLSSWSRTTNPAWFVTA